MEAARKVNIAVPDLRMVRAENLVQTLIRASQAKVETVYVLRGKTIAGTFDLRHRTIDIAVDLRGCHFMDGVNFGGCEFNQTVNLSGCTFYGDFVCGDEDETHAVFQKDLNCNGTTFKAAARFGGVRCEGTTMFRRARFLSKVDPAGFISASFGKFLVCDEARFCGPTSFNAVHCGVGAFFKGARFENETEQVDFTAASFKYLDCSKATFRGPASFNIVKCEGYAHFPQAKFLHSAHREDRSHPLAAWAPSVDFAAASLEYLDCSYTAFKGPVSFYGIECAVEASFDWAEFENEWVDFTAASFKQLRCTNATFKGPASFYGIRCADEANFRGTRFLKESCAYPRWADIEENAVDLRFAAFGSRLVLRTVEFERSVKMEHTQVLSVLDLTSAYFEDHVSFYGTTIGKLVFAYPSFEGKNLDLRACTFERFEGDRDQAKRLVNAQEPATFSTDPYRQLERYYTSIGEEAEARNVYFEGRCAARANAKQRAREAEGSGGWSRGKNVSDFLLKWLTGYGVRTWLLLVPVAFFVVIGTAVFWSDNALQAKAAASPASPGGNVSSAAPLDEQSSLHWRGKLFQRSMYSLDLFLPVLNLGVDQEWERRALWRDVYAVVHIMAGWLVIPLLLASLSGIIRKQ